VYTLSREYEEGQLTFVTPQAFQWFVHLEKLFIAAAPYLSKVKDSRRLTDIFKSTGAAFKFQNCHDIELKILKRFTVFRLKFTVILCLDLANKKQQYQQQLEALQLEVKHTLIIPKAGKGKVPLLPPRNHQRRGLSGNKKHAHKRCPKSKIAASEKLKPKYFI
jgi:hypothetical protein